MGNKTTVTLPNDMLHYIKEPLQKELDQLKQREAELIDILSRIGAPEEVIQAVNESTEVTTKVKSKQRFSISDDVHNILSKSSRLMTSGEIAKEMCKMYNIKGRKRKSMHSSVSSILYQYLEHPNTKGQQFERIKDGRAFLYAVKTTKNEKG